VAVTDPKNNAWSTWISRLGKLIFIVLPVFLLWWVFQAISFEQIWNTLQNLNVIQIVIWLILNTGLVYLMTLRWWLILRVLGYQLSSLVLVRYRLGSFAISYFTPGPQFGGEPFQVLALNQRHKVPGTTGAASVSLDKLFELIANFSFLVVGIGLAITGTWLQGEWRSTGLLLAVGLLVFPLGYLILMLTGRHPLNWLIDKLPQRLTNNDFTRSVREVEKEISCFCIEYPRTVLTVSLISLCVWIGLVMEYWLITCLSVCEIYFSA